MTRTTAVNQSLGSPQDRNLSRSLDRQRPEGQVSSLTLHPEKNTLNGRSKPHPSLSCGLLRRLGSPVLTRHVEAKLTCESRIVIGYIVDAVWLTEVVRF
jgi:hypothetical protein